MARLPGGGGLEERRRGLLAVRSPTLACSSQLFSSSSSSSSSPNLDYEDIPRSTSTEGAATFFERRTSEADKSRRRPLLRGRSIQDEPRAFSLSSRGSASLSSIRQSSYFGRLHWGNQKWAAAQKLRCLNKISLHTHTFSSSVFVCWIS